MSTVPVVPAPAPASGVGVDVRLYAAARAAAGGRDAERLQAASLDALRDELAGSHGPRMAQVLTPRSRT